MHFFFNPKKLEDVESAERSLRLELCASLDLHFVLFCFSPQRHRGHKGSRRIYQNLSVVICGRLKHTVLSFYPTEIAERRGEVCNNSTVSIIE